MSACGSAGARSRRRPHRRAGFLALSLALELERQQQQRERVAGVLRETLSQRRLRIGRGPGCTGSGDAAFGHRIAAGDDHPPAEECRNGDGQHEEHAARHRGKP
jgi:hypothetical protein